MILLSASGWQLVGGIACGAILILVAVWVLLHRRLSEDEIERERRQLLVQSGRLVDGMSLDLFEIPAQDGRTRTMLLYSYRIGGVDYECSQDLTAIPGILETAQLQPGFPCSVRYQPGSPQNSIVVAENWSGLRLGLPVMPVSGDSDRHDLSHLRPGRG